MELQKFLSTLKKIMPRAEYSLRSRAEILGSAPLRFKAPTVRQVIFQSFQFVSAVALSAVFLLLISGGFSAGPRIIPSPLAGLDSLGMQAEAQAVDIQIRLTDVDYAEPQAESSPRAASKQAPSEKKTLLDSRSETGTSTPQGIDDALKALME